MGTPELAELAFEQSQRRCHEIGRLRKGVQLAAAGLIVEVLALVALVADTITDARFGSPRHVRARRSYRHA
jgi:hypothetical protein